MATGALSTTAVGTAYELHCLRYLNNRLQMSLVRCGGSGDEGIDLKGGWWIPSQAFRGYKAPIKKAAGHRIFQSNDVQEFQEEIRKEDKELDRKEINGAKRIRVFGQCKAQKNALSSRQVREMEGVLAHHYGQAVSRGPHQFTSKGRPRPHTPPRALGLILSQSGFSQMALIRAWKSPAPLMLIHLSGGRPLAERSPSAVEPDHHPTLEAARNVLVLNDLNNKNGNINTNREKERNESFELDSQGEGDQERIPVVGAWWNKQVIGTRGIFKDGLELRRIMFGNGKDAEGTYQVWWNGKPLPRSGPSVDIEVD
ncbi:hypothetical protein BCR39DRAFT_585787 [Naematelia encephala]|uniref:Uncharacterized protein n=1 Tax=Naematelia encephala TaxID=71784 RepID=A0A1Y2BJ70_9TREE|nr:hypothetical protein BCR39DRAFT_585787 [Naematelia encephala]